MNIILIGFMGSGKTAVGWRLAEELKMSFLDTDDLIVKLERLAINDIFAQKGEPYFRDLETRVVKTLRDYDNFVVATGGGMVLRAENVKMLKALGPLVLLRAGPETVFARVKKDQQRPLLNTLRPLAKIRELMAVRQPVYEQAADYAVDTPELTIDEAVLRIVEWIRSK